MLKISGKGKSKKQNMANVWLALAEIETTVADGSSSCVSDSIKRVLLQIFGTFSMLFASLMSASFSHMPMFIGHAAII